MANLIEPKTRERLSVSGNHFFLMVSFAIRQRVDVYLLLAPQNSPIPYCVVRKSNAGKKYTHEGAAGLSSSAIRCDCYGDTYRTTKMMAQQIINRLKTWPPDDNSVHAVFLAGEIDNYIEESKMFQVTLEFTVWHTF